MAWEDWGIQDFVKELFEDVKATDSVEYRSKNFLDSHPQKVKGLVRKWHNQFSTDDVIAMYDESIFENGLDGMIFTERGVAWDYAFDRIYVMYKDIEHIETKYGLLNQALVINYIGKDGDSHHAFTSNVYYKPDRLKRLFSVLVEHTNDLDTDED